VLPLVSHDPDVWIQSLENMKRRLQILGHPMSEMDLIIHILQNLPKEYETTLELLENDLENDVATLDRVKEKLRTKFEQLQRGKSMSDNALMIVNKVKNVQGKSIQAPKNPDGALMNGGKAPAYKGLCAYCGIYGHKANNCLKRMNKGASNVNKNKSSGDSSYFPGVCFKCNKKGHKSFDCPLKAS
jgi:gag-polypeptide of LTR copia-type/Zinc knuckle